MLLPQLCLRRWIDGGNEEIRIQGQVFRIDGKRFVRGPSDFDRQTDRRRRQRESRFAHEQRVRQKNLERKRSRIRSSSFREKIKVESIFKCFLKYAALNLNRLFRSLRKITSEKQRINYALFKIKVELRMPEKTFG